VKLAVRLSFDNNVWIEHYIHLHQPLRNVSSIAQKVRVHTQFHTWKNKLWVLHWVSRSDPRRKTYSTSVPTHCKHSQLRQFSTCLRKNVSEGQSWRGSFLQQDIVISQHVGKLHKHQHLNKNRRRTQLYVKEPNVMSLRMYSSFTPVHSQYVVDEKSRAYPILSYANPIVFGVLIIPASTYINQHSVL
jgi:hypothetical protein